MELLETSMVVAISPQIAENGGFMVLPEYAETLCRYGMEAALIVPGEGGEHAEQALRAAQNAPIDSLLPAGTCGIIIPGGDDIDARLYGQRPASTAQAPHPVRDAIEPRLVAYALEHGMPLLGICRGMQMINVSQGGTLIQSLAESNSLPIDQKSSNPTVASAAINHNQEDKPTRVAHTVTLLPDTPLNFRQKPVEAGVNSLHNQAIDVLGKDVFPCAVAEDNVIEGVHMHRTGFVLGVQWHPESMEDPQAQDIVFKPFIEACRQYHRAKLQTD